MSSSLKWELLGVEPMFCLEPKRRAEDDVTRTRSWKQWYEVGTAGIRALSMDRHDLQFCSKTVMSTIAQPVVVTEARLRNISGCLEGTRVLEYLCGCQSEVTERTAFGDGDWAEDGESRGSTTGFWKSLQTTA